MLSENTRELPPPSALFHGYYSRSRYIVLPPPSSLPGHSYMRIGKHRQVNRMMEPLTIRHDEAAVAAAATLASFSRMEKECVQLEACAGQGGNYECEYCGYNFKHLNCLQRHGWQHTEIHSAMTKEQQTQLLEAAQTLINIARFGMKMRMLQ